MKTVTASLLLALALLAGWFARYQPVPSRIPALQVVWDRLLHRYCFIEIAHRPAPANFDQLWDSRDTGWVARSIGCRAQ